MALSAEYDSAYDTLLSDHSVAIGSRSANAIRKWKVIVHLWSKRQHSSGRSLGNLDPVDEDFPGWFHLCPLFALLYINI